MTTSCALPLDAWRRLIGVLILWLAVACVHKNKAFELQMAAAENERRNRDFAAERTHFSNAARVAKSERDRVEALYRRAQSWARQGEPARAIEELRRLVDAHPKSERTPRAWLDMGRLYEKSNDIPSARLAYERVFSHYPDSGNALTAAKRFVSLSSATDRGRAALWQRLVADNQSPLLEEGLRFEWARSLESWEPKRAIEHYQLFARRFPLPDGTFTDDALLRCARLQRQRGDVRGALLTLGPLLSQHEKALIIGSYSRTSYVEGWLLKARIERDDKGDCKAASDTFLELTLHFPTSRQADDALYERALCERDSGNDPCNAVRLLVDKYPASALLGCARMLCPHGEFFENLETRPCHGGTTPPRRSDEHVPATPPASAARN